MVAVPVSSFQSPGIQMSVSIIQLTVVLVCSYQIVKRDAPTVPCAMLKAILVAANSEISKTVTTENVIFHTVPFSGKVVLSHCTRLYLARCCENHVVDNPKDYFWWANKRHPKRKMQTTVSIPCGHNFSIRKHERDFDANSNKIDKIHKICTIMVSMKCIRRTVDFLLSARMWPIYSLISTAFFSFISLPVVILSCWFCTDTLASWRYSLETRKILTQIPSAILTWLQWVFLIHKFYNRKPKSYKANTGWQLWITISVMIKFIFIRNFATLRVFRDTYNCENLM